MATKKPRGGKLARSAAPDQAGKQTETEAPSLDNAPDGTRQDKEKSRSEAMFPVVGVGASAGGLEALQAFFKATPADPGLAFVVVVHLAARQKSMLPELIQECTPLSVERITNGMPVQVNRIHVVPPGHLLSIEGGVLALSPDAGPRPIDSFFRSLAEDRGASSACVVLSGTGSDGSLGLEAVKGAAGVAMVQDHTAQYEEMPRGATATGQADFVLPPHEMPAQLMRCFDTSTTTRPAPSTEVLPDQRPLYRKIFALLQARIGRDFSQYKTNTILRRVERRMAVNLIEELGEYVAFLQSNEAEARTLFKEFLIGVTSFFRDPTAFEALEAEVAAAVDRRENEEPIRVWVPGCSTGEEAYSIAMLIHERAHAAGKHIPVQVFGTDIDEEALETARRGRYPATIEAALTSDRLERNFDRDESGTYQVKRLIREMLVFAVQDVTADPPFSRLDILACRNLLIYLSAPVQSHLLSIFHYSLLPDGVLFLGSSETVGTSELFDRLDRKHRLYRRRPGTPSRNTLFRLSRLTDGVAPARMPGDHQARGDRQSQLMYRAILQQSEAPPCVVVDSAMEVVYIHGRTGRFLEPPEGAASVNLVDMARPGLKTPLATCVRKVVRGRKEVRQRDITVQTGGGQVDLDLTVRPVLEPQMLSDMSIVFFEVHEPSVPQEESSGRPPHGELESRAVADLRRQLVDTQENLQSTIEELETANEELKSTNEELQSTNEELQSSNEELQTSKEELQSVNEESVMVNAELASRIDDLGTANDDLKNLLDSTGIATIFLDADFNIRRFTRGITALIPLAANDTGRPLSHFTTAFVDLELEGIAAAVLDDLVIREQEIRTADGSHFLLRVRPYRTTNNVIDGTVLTFEDRTVIKEAQAILETRLDRSAAELVETTSKLQRATDTTTPNAEKMRRE